MSAAGYGDPLRDAAATGARVSGALFTTGGLRARELTEADIPRLQHLLDESPGYFRTISGAPAPADEAKDEFHSLPPPEWAQGRKWTIGFEDRDGELAGIANLIADLFAPGIWHVGLFLMAESRPGTGGAVYRDLEAWMRGQGARWVRLGVVLGNDRGERFWRRQGYRELRRRTGVKIGQRFNVLLVMAKPLDGGSWDEYARLVPRDSPDSP